MLSRQEYVLLGEKRSWASGSGDGGGGGGGRRLGASLRRCAGMLPFRLGRKRRSSWQLFVISEANKGFGKGAWWEEQRGGEWRLE